MVMNPPASGVGVPAAAMSGADTAVDYEKLLERCSGDRAMMKKLAAKFQDKSRQTWADLLKNFESKDVAGITRLAHGLKGTASNLAANRVAALAGQLEELGRSDDLSNCAVDRR